MKEAEDNKMSIEDLIKHSSLPGEGLDIAARDRKINDLLMAAER